MVNKTCFEMNTKLFLAKTDHTFIQKNANVSLEKSINENPMFRKILRFGNIY